MTPQTKTSSEASVIVEGYEEIILWRPTIKISLRLAHEVGVKELKCQRNSKPNRWTM